MVAKIATGEVEDNATAPDKAHHSAGGKKGGSSLATHLGCRMLPDPCFRASLTDWAGAVKVRRAAR